MHNRKKHFLQILQIELEDLKEDIDLLIEQYRQEQEQGHMTEHVFFSNIAVFRNEERGLRQFKAAIDSIDPDQFQELDELISHCKSEFLKRIKECGLAPFIDILVDRKIKKVAQYVSQ